MVGLSVAEKRRAFHENLCSDLLFFSTKEEKGDVVRVASNADKAQRASREIAESIADQLGAVARTQLPGQTSGALFEEKVATFLKQTFLRMKHLRPGNWAVEQVKARSQSLLSEFDQFHHLGHLAGAAKADSELLASLGNDYTISPDLVVRRFPEADDVLFSSPDDFGAAIAQQASLRAATSRGDQLHASISCKWTMRSDRAQNSRSEALNLIRNRKGRTPHIIAVVGEPTPSRIASLALGTGDLDCVYHFALPELRKAVVEFGEDEALSLLDVMIEGRRLKDISDLPFDLCV